MGTFFGHLQFSSLCDLDRLGGLVSSSLGHVLYLLHNIVALKDFSENDVLPIEPTEGAISIDLEKILDTRELTM